jgi:hypothetical protein
MGLGLTRRIGLCKVLWFRVWVGGVRAVHKDRIVQADGVRDDQKDRVVQGTMV